MIIAMCIIRKNDFTILNLFAKDLLKKFVLVYVLLKKI